MDCPRYSPERKEVWTAQQARAFLDGTREHWLHPLWALAVYSGCRIGELVALEWSDLDLEAGSLTIRRAGQYIAGEWMVTTPKTSAGTRRLRLPQEAIDGLRAHQAEQAQERLRQGADWTAGDLVFVGPRSGKPLDTTTVENAAPEAAASSPGEGCAPQAHPDPHSTRVKIPIANAACTGPSTRNTRASSAPSMR
mgnify:CR=1 FL=1